MAKHPLPDLIIVIPGILGSTLGTPNTTRFWAVTRRSLHSIPHLWTHRRLHQLIDHLTDTYDLTEATPGRAGNLVKFHYDWRLSNRLNGRRLATVAFEHHHRWRRHSGNGGAKIVVIGHSMGGLVARWFLDVEGGHAECRRLITISTPYQGAPKAIDAIVNGVHKGVGPIGLDLTDFVRSLPSVHQLLPVYHCVGAPGTVLKRPTESGLPALATPLALDAALFHEQLATAAKLTAGSYPVFALKGLFQPTPQVARLDGDRVELDTLGDGRHHYCRPSPGGSGDVDVVNAEGDGTVPRVSSHPANWANEDDRDAGAHAGLRGRSCSCAERWRAARQHRPDPYPRPSWPNCCRRRIRALGSRGDRHGRHIPVPGNR